MYFYRRMLRRRQIVPLAIFVIYVLTRRLQKYVTLVNQYEPDAVDVVYTWVNGSDPNFKMLLETTYQQTKGYQQPRKSYYRDYDQIRYSLRSLEKHANWIRNIFIVSNGQYPNWLNTTTSRIHLVSHSDIFPNQDHLPTFNSAAIEVHLHRIKGLSQNFLYFNDDFLLGAKITLQDFKTSASGYKIYLASPLPTLHQTLIVGGSKVKASYNEQESKQEINLKPFFTDDPYIGSLHYTAHIFQVFYGGHIHNQIAHIPYLLNREILESLQNKFPILYERTSSHKFRHVTDIQFAFSYYNYLRLSKRSSADKSRKLQYHTELVVINKTMISDFVSLSRNIKEMTEVLNRVATSPSKFICINDNIDYNRDEASMISLIISFYKSLYPNPSSFELQT